MHPLEKHPLALPSLSTLLTYNRPLNRTMMYEGHKDEENISIVILRGVKTF